MSQTQGCRAIQVLLKKKPDWQPEAGDEDFELTSDYFLTGVGDGSTDVDPLLDLKPVRHGFEEVGVSNCWFDDDCVRILPYCFIWCDLQLTWSL